MGYYELPRPGADKSGLRGAQYHDEEENSRLKRWWPTKRYRFTFSKRVNAKKVVSPSARRRAVKMSVEKGLGKVAAACRALGLSRSSYYRSGRSSLESRRIRKELLELSAKHPRYGYRRITDRGETAPLLAEAES